MDPARRRELCDPFALLICPDAVLREVAQSERLARLRSRVVHPLDEAEARLATPAPEDHRTAVPWSAAGTRAA